MPTVTDHVDPDLIIKEGILQIREYETLLGFVNVEWVHDNVVPR